MRLNARSTIFSAISSYAAWIEVSGTSKYEVAEKNNSVFEKAGIDIVTAFSLTGLFNDHGNIHRFRHSDSPVSISFFTKEPIPQVQGHCPAELALTKE